MAIMTMATIAASRAPGLTRPFRRDSNSFSVSASGMDWPIE